MPDPPTAALAKRVRGLTGWRRCLVAAGTGAVSALAMAPFFLWPVLWLLSIPFRIVGYALGGMLALVKGLFFLPARILGVR